MPKDLLKLNLGCGSLLKPKDEGWLNVDYEKFEGVDKVIDLNKLPYPFKENSVEEFFLK